MQTNRKQSPFGDRQDLIEAVVGTDGMPKASKEIFARETLDLEHLADEITARYAVVAMKLRNNIAADLHGPSSGDLGFQFTSKERSALSWAERELGAGQKHAEDLRKKLLAISKKIDSVIL